MLPVTAFWVGSLGTGSVTSTSLLLSQLD